MAALRREFPEAKKRKCHEKGQNLKKDSQEYSNFQKPPPSPPPFLSLTPLIKISHDIS